MKRIIPIALILSCFAILWGIVQAQTPSGGYTSPASGGTVTGTSPIVVTGNNVSCPTCGTSSGTVTSASFTGGLISVATPTTTPALTVAGTSGGIPYFSGAATWASSAAGTVNTLMKWGGAGNPPIASSVTDNGTTVSTAEPIATTSTLSSGANSGAAGQLILLGSTSGSATLTASSSGGTITANGSTSATNIAAGNQINAVNSYLFNGKLFAVITSPTIASAGCGGSGATISNANGTIAFDINVGTGPTSAGCTVTLSAATTGWVCSANDQTTQSATVFVQKQTGAVSATSVTIQTFAATGSANAPTAADVYHVSCFGH